MKIKPLTILSCILLIGCSKSPESNPEILWDTYGVPHIYADNYNDLFYAYGWSQMRNHGNLLLKLYAQARGQGAEYFGEKHLESDQWVHIHNVMQRSRDWWKKQDPDIKEMMTAFTDGINDYAKENPDEIDELNELILPVRPEDCFSHFQRVILFHFVTNPGAATFNPASMIKGGGSNTWAIGPSRSESGNAMLIANPHLPWFDMFTWFEAHTISNDLNAYGAGLVGMPFLGIAFNDYMGWSHTNNVHDGQDLYELTLKGDGYQWGEEVLQFEERSVEIKVRNVEENMLASEFLIRESVHGPVVSEKDGKAYALRVVGLNQPHVFRQYFDMARAKTLKSFQDAIRPLQNPFFTIMYADKDGHIMHVFGGRTPIRPAGDWNWLGVVPGDSPETIWNETHSYDELPKSIDPESGWLQNANDPPWTTTFPRAIIRKNYPDYMSQNFMHFRAQRSARMAFEDRSITFAELMDYKMDTRMELADRVLDDLLALTGNSNDKIIIEASQVLSSWDRQTNGNSQGAVLFKAWVDSVKFFVNNSELFEGGWEEEKAMDTPFGLHPSVDYLSPLKSAAESVIKTYGHLDVPWGEVYRLIRDDIDLPANGGPGDPYGLFRVTNFAPVKDDRFMAVGGDSYQAVIEFGDKPKAMALLSYGNASQKGSKHRTDQLKFYSEKKMRPVWRNKKEIEQHLELREILNPNKD
ncbi:MAG: acylase [Candidatus Marinimicrobia bacterium]|nr:acylase [Candidatus Neomarinimicrobiota bacterium]